MEVIRVEDISRWNEVINSFEKKSVYYSNEYVNSIMLEKEETASLLYFAGRNSALCFPVVISDISRDSSFSGILEEGKYYDMETPYGYGGPLADFIDENDLQVFRKEIEDWAEEEGVVSLFTRFNPLDKNYAGVECFYDEIRYLHHTIYIDTSEAELIDKNMDPKCRNMIRKASKSGVTIEIDQQLKDIDEFISLYEGVMDDHEAASMYYFPRKYYEYLRDEYKGHIIMAKARYEEQIIAASLFIYDENEMHYHLSGSLREYKNLAATNLILAEAAKWAADKGIKAFHLGGGMSEEDSLYKFKKRFNRNGQLDFYIGKQIFDRDKYGYLLDCRCKADKEFNRANKRMIQYRA